MVVMLALVSACSTTSPSRTYQGNNQTQTVRGVTGVGRTFDEAKNNGFTVAIERAVGSVLLVDKELRNDRLTRDDILSHSAGYVDDYKVISRIAERMLNRGGIEGKLDGNRLGAQYQSYMTERGSGDKLLNNLLRDFPSRAMEVKQGRIDFMLDSRRNSVIVVPYEITWDKRYLNSMEEVLSVLHDTSSGHEYNIVCRCYPSSERVVLHNNGKKEYFFNDGVRVRQLTDSLSQQIKIKAEVKDNFGKTLYSGCYFSTGGFKGRTQSGVYVIWNNIERNRLEITVEPDSYLARNLHRADRVELSLKAESCEN
jgi:hypothetical protein